MPNRFFAIERNCLCSIKPIRSFKTHTCKIYIQPLSHHQNLCIKLLYCSYCKKEVVIFGISSGSAIESDLEKYKDNIEKNGKLMLFNPPPFEPYYCPNCMKKLK